MQFPGVRLAKIACLRMGLAAPAWQRLWPNWPAQGMGQRSAGAAITGRLIAVRRRAVLHTIRGKKKSA